MVKTLGATLGHQAHDLLFKTIHQRYLIYNMCWEDPRIDRQLLGLDRDSKVVVLTSAGCNALDYLLDGPAEIHAVDVNPRQNALLQLKLALIERGDFGDLEQMFRQGAHPRFRELYQAVRPRLPPYAAAFWDKKISYFDPPTRKRSFYYRGTCGAVAWLVTRQLLKSGASCATICLICWTPGTSTSSAPVYPHRTGAVGPLQYLATAATDRPGHARRAAPANSADPAALSRRHHRLCQRQAAPCTD
jgi:hypothetical protein